MSDVEARRTGSVDPRDWTLFQRLKESSHPVAVVFYVFYRLAPIALYIFGMFFTSNFVLVFILLALLLAADFWNVKNISGRLLVGLRWWNETSPSGESIWVFETADPERYINPIDSRVFWFLLYICPVSWGVLGFLALIKLHVLWLLLVILALVLTTTNTLAFSKCDKFSKANNIFGSVNSGILSRAWGFAAGRLFG